MSVSKLAAAAITAGIILTTGASSARAGYDTDYCREYTRPVQIGGRTQEAYGQACLQPDGAWRIVNEDLSDRVVATPRDYYDVDRERVVYVESGPQVVFAGPPRRYYKRHHGWYHGRGHHKRFHHVHHGKFWAGHRW